MLHEEISMKRPILSLLVAGLMLCGCTSHYVIRLSNGQEVITASKPKVVGGSYHYKDAHGNEHTISRGRVQAIEPASMARDEYRSPQPVQSKPKKHWYFLWLA